MIWLITGGNGFVGQYAKEELSKTHLVYTLDRSGSKDRHVAADIRDRFAVYNMVSDLRPHVILHLAAQSSVKASFDNPSETIDVNVTGTKNVLDAVCEKSPRTRVVVVSSAEVYGVLSEVPASETHPCNPVSPYGESRLQQEALVREYVREHGLSAVIARSFSHTGPGQDERFFCPSIAHQVARIEAGLKEPIIETGNTRIVRDFSDVRDVMVAYECLAESMACDTYNVCSGKGMPLHEIVSTLVSLSNVPIRVHEDGALVRAVDIPVLVGNPAKIKKELGWDLHIPFTQTLKELLDYNRRVTRARTSA